MSQTDRRFFSWCQHEDSETPWIHRRSGEVSHTSPAAAAALLPDSGERERVEAKKSQTRERRQKTAGRGKEVREEGNVERGIRTPPPRGETTSHVARDRGGSWRSGTVREALTSKLLNPGRAAGRGHSSNH